jgi:hypothetical protein
VENRVELVQSPHLYGDATSVAISPISFIVFDA